MLRKIEGQPSSDNDSNIIDLESINEISDEMIKEDMPETLEEAVSTLEEAVEITQVDEVDLDRDHKIKKAVEIYLKNDREVDAKTKAKIDDFAHKLQDRIWRDRGLEKAA